MKILMIGDVFGRVGRDMLFEYSERGFFGADAVIANAENAAHGRGITKRVYDEIKQTSVDCFTLGNHTWDNAEAESVLKYNDEIIRPYNLEGELPGSGTMVFTAKNGVKIGVINLIGRVEMAVQSANPFLAADNAIKRLRERCDIIAVDFHAEATSEKLAMGYYLDGRVSIVAGTHTHVQTADGHTMPKGTGYITDLGMTGPAVSVLGMDKNIIVNRFVTGLPKRFETADGKGQFCAAMFEVDEKTKKTISMENIFIKK